MQETEMHLGGTESEVNYHATAVVVLHHKNGTHNKPGKKYKAQISQMNYKHQIPLTACMFTKLISVTA